jgi:hypothetical protein
MNYSIIQSLSFVTALVVAAPYVLGDTHPTTYVAAAPTVGPAPLTAKIIGRSAHSSYQLDFGDGSPSIGQGNGGCRTSCGPTDFTATHTYPAAGTFTITLQDNGYPNPPHYVTSTTTIAVTTSQVPSSRNRK